jgi:predicted molibdopterin-dependent oxidoreductase YjgC
VGALGREGVGVNPLRGQNNVQGAADMGCQPDRFPGDAPVADDEARARIGRVWGRELPSAPGRTLPAMWDAIERGEIRGLILFGEDVAQTDPDARRVRRLLDSLEFVLVLELFPSETAKHATVVLPGASFLEKDGTFTNGERRIQRVRAVLPPLEGCRPDWRILLDLMAATGWPQALRSPAEVMSEIARVAPRFAGATYDRLEQDGVQWPAPASDHPGTPILHRESFPRGKGLLSRVEFVPSPELRAGLTLVTGRRLEHYNAGTMTRRTPNETLAPLDELEISPADARERGIETGARVRVASARGAIEMTARVTASAPSGTVFTTFHHPETPVNELTSNVRDRISDCPEYKITAVEVSRAG